MENEEVIWGRRGVVEALRGERRIRQIWLAAGTRVSGPLQVALDDAQAAGIPIATVPRQRLDRICRTEHHQGIAASAEAYAYVSPEDLLALAAEQGEPPLLLALDSLQDPQNLGSLMRAAEATGAHGIIIPRHRAVGITPGVVKASAGAVEHIRTARVANLARALEELKGHGVWVVGVDMDGPQAYDEADLAIPLVLVVGGEGKGLGRLVKEKCDFVVRLPMHGRVESLNAAIAGAVVLYEARRQRERGSLGARRR